MGLGFVDYVVIFDEDTPLNLITKIKPDVLVKGADYKGKEVVGSEIVKEVRLIDFVEGKSTTGIIKRIKDAKNDDKKMSSRLTKRPLASSVNLLGSLERACRWWLIR